jgi:hypothetical protein
MSMSARIIRLLLASCLIPLAWFGTGEFSALAAVEKPKKEMRRLLAQPPPSEGQTSMALGKARSKTRNKVDRGKPPQVHSTKSKHPVMPKTGRRNGSSGQPVLTIQPKPDLSYHGILEHPQRYDPSLQRHKGSAHNPGTGDLLHDHFQELDKNRDGVLDPFERALGRLDMDRDLSNRKWD